MLEAIEHVEEYPCCINAKNHPHFVELEKGKLAVSYVGKGSHTDFGSVQSNCPAPIGCDIYYFECKIVSCGSTTAITVGLSDQSFLLNRQPGAETNSYGYRGDDGKKFISSARPEPYGSPLVESDVVGCGIHYPKQEVFFTRNGTYLGKAGDLGPSPYYPTVGLRTHGEKVQLNFAGPFVYDLNAAVEEELNEERDRLSSYAIHKSDTLSVIQTYLLHAGFLNTLKAFEKSLGVEGTPLSSFLISEKDSDSMALDSSTDEGSGPRREIRKEEDTGVSAEADGGGGVPSWHPPLSTSSPTGVGMSSRPTRQQKSRPSKSSETQDSKEIRPSLSFSSVCSGRVGGPCVFYELDDLIESDGEVDGRTDLVYTKKARDGLKSTLPIRHQIRSYITEGNIEEAINLLRAQYPSTLSGPPNLAVVLLFTQQFVELMRAGRNSEAVEWMRSSIAPLRNSAPPLRVAIVETCALVAYPDSESNPLAHHYDESRRMLTAYLVNLLILGRVHRTCQWSPLHVLLRHVIACRSVVWEQHSSRGRPVTSRMMCQPSVYRKTIAHRAPTSTG